MSCSLHSPSVSVHSGRAGLIFLGSSSSPLSPPFPTLLTGLWDCPQPPRSLQRFGVGTRERASLGAGARSSFHGNLMFVASPSSSPAKVLGGGGGVVVSGFLGSSCGAMSLLEAALGDLELCGHRRCGSGEDPLRGILRVRAATAVSTLLVTHACH